MIVISRSSVKRLVEKGTVDVWTPRNGDNAPAGNITHVVRTRATGDSFGHCKLTAHRPAVLQDLTLPEAVSAGFKHRDDFYAYWRKRYATGPLMTEPVLCWVGTYVRVNIDVPLYLKKGGGYTSSAREALDVGEVETDAGWVPMALESVTDRRFLRVWAEKADRDRLARVAERKAEWKQYRRFGRAA